MAWRGFCSLVYKLSPVFAGLVFVVEGKCRLEQEYFDWKYVYWYDRF
jgi:hypothetical protein